MAENGKIPERKDDVEYEGESESERADRQRVERESQRLVAELTRMCDIYRQRKDKGQLSPTKRDVSVAEIVEELTKTVTEDNFSDGNACIVRLAYDFGQTHFTSLSSLVYTYHISIIGLAPPLKQEMMEHFPSTTYKNGNIEILVNNHFGNAPTLEVGTALKFVASLLSYLRGKGFSIMSSGEDTFAPQRTGCVTKTHCWTLQK